RPTVVGDQRFDGGPLVVAQSRGRVADQGDQVVLGPFAELGPIHGLLGGHTHQMSCRWWCAGCSCCSPSVAAARPGASAHGPVVPTADRGPSSAACILVT